MKFYITLFCFLMLNFCYTQKFDTNWNEVTRLEIAGKIKSANNLVEKIHRKASRKKDNIQVIKCFFYESKFSEILDPNSQTVIFNNLNAEIRKTKDVPAKSILNYIKANLLIKYLNKNRYKIASNSKTPNSQNDDFRIWSIEDFESEISTIYDKTISNETELNKISLFEYKELFEISPFTNSKEISLYHFLLNEYLNYLQPNLNKGRIQKSFSENLYTEIYESTDSFINTDFKAILSLDNFYKALQLLQKKEKIYSKFDASKIDVEYFNRLIYINKIVEQDSIFTQRIIDLKEKTTNKDLIQRLLLTLVKLEINKYPKKQNVYIESLKVLDTILKNNNNKVVLAEAEVLKNNIKETKLSISLESELYSNQNSRALIYFKNIDTLTAKYYKLPTEDFLGIIEHSNAIKDSLFKNYIAKHKPFKTTSLVLPNKKDFFENSTEVLLEPLEIGNYIISFEALTGFDTKELIFSPVKVSDIIFLEDNLGDLKDTFFIYDKKTGKPLDGVKVSNNETTMYSDDNGKVSFNKKEYLKNQNLYSELTFIKGIDTLKTSYKKDWYYNNPNDIKIIAKPMVYFDRAIYRPGQKMHYKTIVFQKTQNKKLVVPFVSFLVTIFDSNDNVLKEETIQTNEFGSFSGEFDIPKNILTGEFYIEIEEPKDYTKDEKYYNSEEDEHLFWDNVDYTGHSNFYFHVEEYKRPTFEISIDPIKECYTIGDTLTLTGKAMSLSGSNLTNAKVNYSISKNINYGNYTKSTNTTNTDNEGKFSIQLIANDSLIALKNINKINFETTITVTDLNGETQSIVESFYLDNTSLKLDVKINNAIFKEDKNTIKITASNFNNYPIATKGILKIFKLKSPKSLLQRKFFAPETPTISKDDFKKRFPYEPYDNDDSLDNEEEKKTLIRTINFDTKDGNDIALDFKDNYELGSYQIQTEIIDTKNHKITKNNVFELKSNLTPSINEIFSFSIDNLSDKHFIIINFKSILPELYITTRLYQDDFPSAIKTTHLKNGSGILKINRAQLVNSPIFFHFSTFWESTYFYKEKKNK